MLALESVKRGRLVNKSVLELEVAQQPNRESQWKSIHRTKPSILSLVVIIAVVSVEGSINGSTWKQYEIIDGQQRLATFALFAACLMHAYQRLKLEHPDTHAKHLTLAAARAEHLLERFVQVKLEVNLQPETRDRLTLSEPDRQLFSDLINAQSVNPNSGRESHARLVSARDIIRGWLNQRLASCNSISAKLEALRPLTEILHEDVTIIYVATEKRAEAYRLFAGIE